MGDPVFNISKTLEHNKSNEMGKHIIYKESTTTTMDDAREIGINGAPHGTAVIAEVQTDARGSKNHIWSALHTGNIFVSFIVHNIKDDQGFTARFNCEVAGSLAVLQAVSDIGLSNINTKWQNDLWIKGHKLAGFLLEEVDFDIPDTHPTKHLAILGIGLNVNSDVRRNPGLRSLATSVKCELNGREVDREELFANICNYLEINLAKTTSELYGEYIKYQIFQPGYKVVANSVAENKVLKAEVVEIKENWNMVFKTDEGLIVEDDNKFSLRPRPSYTVYIVNSGNIDLLSSQRIYRTLQSLLDTSRYNIRYLKMQDIENGFWRENAQLVVIGDINESVVCDWTKAEEILSSYVSDGGRLLCLHRSISNLQLTKHFIGEAEQDSESSNQESIKTISIKTRNGAEQSESLINVCYQGNCLNFTIENSGDEALAYYADRNPQQSVAVSTNTVNNGKIGLCGFNLEIYHEDFENFADLKNSHLELENYVFQQDALFQEILKMLDIQ